MRLLSRKLAGTVAAMVAIVGIVALAQTGSVDKDIVLFAITACCGLGGYQIMRQAGIDQD